MAAYTFARGDGHGFYSPTSCTTAFASCATSNLEAHIYHGRSQQIYPQRAGLGGSGENLPTTEVWEMKGRRSVLPLYEYSSSTNAEMGVGGLFYCDVHRGYIVPSHEPSGASIVSFSQFSKCAVGSLIG